MSNTELIVKSFFTIVVLVVAIYHIKKYIKNER
jgi:hypothetical protein